MSLKLIMRTKILRDSYRGINELKKGYQPRINIIEDENGNLLVDPQCFEYLELFFNQMINVHRVMMLGRRIYIWLSH